MGFNFSSDLHSAARLWLGMLPVSKLGNSLEVKRSACWYILKGYNQSRWQLLMYDHKQIFMARSSTRTGLVNMTYGKSHLCHPVSCGP
jgi:hypothetical protein